MRSPSPPTAPGLLRLAAVVAAGALAACATVAGPGTVRRDLDWFSIEVPEDWSFSAYREGAARPGRAFTGGGAELRAPDGRFVEIHRDLGWAPLDSDVAWSARLTADGRLEVAGPEAFCAGPVLPAAADTAPARCLAGDGRLDVTFRLEAGGRLFLVHLGHAARERPEDLAALRAMLGTFQVR